MITQSCTAFLTFSSNENEDRGILSGPELSVDPVPLALAILVLGPNLLFVSRGEIVLKMQKIEYGKIYLYSFMVRWFDKRMVSE